MCHVKKYSTIRRVFRGGSNSVCQGLPRPAGVDPRNEVVNITHYVPGHYQGNGNSSPP